MASRPSSTFAAVALVAAVLLASALAPAAAQNPVPLPSDANLAAYFSVSGSFHSETANETRNLEMACWASEYAANETIDFATMSERAFLSYGLPADDGWGVFDAVGETLHSTVRITDAQNRLARVEIREFGTNRLVAAINADGAHHEISGAFDDDAAVREYVATVVSTGDATLAIVAVDRGKPDKVVPLTFNGVFEPYRYQTIACEHGLGGDGVQGTEAVAPEGPLVAPGKLTWNGYLPPSRSCAVAHFANDQPASSEAPPPSPPGIVARKQVIFNSAQPGMLLLAAAGRLGDAASVTAVNGALAAAVALSPTDQLPALYNLPVVPYSSGAGHWHLRLNGQALAVWGVSYERKRSGALLNVLATAVGQSLQAAKDFLSQLFKARAQAYLSDEANQIATCGLTPKDIYAIGDICTVTGAQDLAVLAEVAPITQSVTFTFAPDILPMAPDTWSGRVDVTRGAALTTPAPPTPTSITPLMFSPGTLTGVRAVPKGWSYTVVGAMPSPGGCYDSSTQEVIAPVPGGAVSAPVTLKVLLKLKVWVVPPQGRQPTSVYLKRTGQADRVAYCQSDGQGHWFALFTSATPNLITPGDYTVETWIQGSPVLHDVKPLTIATGQLIEETLNPH